jgi:hypothetical protein
VSTPLFSIRIVENQLPAIENTHNPSDYVENPIPDSADTPPSGTSDIRLSPPNRSRPPSPTYVHGEKAEQMEEQIHH